MTYTYLTLTKSHDVLPDGAQILIVPSGDRWNDFGFRVRVEVGIIINSKDIVWIPAYLAIKDEPDTTRYIRAIIKDIKNLLPIDRLELPFALLLFETQGYTLIRNHLGEAGSREVLASLNDASLLYANKSKVSGWDDFFESRVFNEAMIRASESYFAFRRGADVLENEQWYEEDTQKSFSVTLAGDGPKLEFNFNFDSSNLLRGRIAIIVGKNGLGKTASLTKMAKAFSGSDLKYAHLSCELHFNQVLAFGPLGDRKLRKRKTKAHRSAAVRTFTFNPRLDRAYSRDGFARLLVDIARTQDDEGHSFLAFYQSILSQEMGQLKIYIPIKEGGQFDYQDSNGRKYLALINWMKGGEKLKLQRASEVDFARNLLYLDDDLKPRKLSTGQFAFLKFSLSAISNAGPASIFLIDEPENFLHPNLISQFMRLLNRILSGTRSIAIVATHSPFVVREVQAKQVHVICEANESGMAYVTHPRLQTLGANVGNISDEVFGDDLPVHLYEELIQSINPKIYKSFNSFLDEFASEISVEALIVMRDKLGELD